MSFIAEIGILARFIIKSISIDEIIIVQLSLLNMSLISVKHPTKSWLSKNMHKLSILMLYLNIASSISCCWYTPFIERSVCDI